MMTNEEYILHLLSELKIKDDEIDRLNALLNTLVEKGQNRIDANKRLVEKLVNE